MATTSTKSLRAATAMSSIAVAVVALAVVVPLFAVLSQSIRIDGSFSSDAIERILGAPRTWRVIALTLMQAAVSTALTMAVGLPIAWVLSRYEFRGRKVIRTAAMVPFVLPSVVIGVAFATLLGPRGIADLRGTWWAIFAAHVCFNLAVVIRIVGSALDSVDPNLEHAARLLGARPATVIRRVTMPTVAPSLYSAGAIVFLYSLTSFGVIVLLGGGAVTTIEVEIWTRATRQFDLSGAAVLAGMQALLVVAVLLIRSPAGRARSSRAAQSNRIRVSDAPMFGWQRLAVIATGIAVFAISVLPLLAILERSFLVGDSYSFAHWNSVGSVTEGTGLSIGVASSIRASLLAAIPAAAVAMIVGVPAAHAVARRPNGFAARVLLLPLAISATTVGLGLLLVAARGPVDIRRSPWLVIFAQTLVALPIVVRSVAPSIRAIPRTILDAGELSGASALRRWIKVQFPMMSSAVAGAAGLAAVIALGEFGATVFVARTSEPTIPVAIQRLMSRPGQAGVGQAMVLACVLVAICGVILWSIDRMGATDSGVSLGE